MGPLKRVVLSVLCRELWQTVWFKRLVEATEGAWHSIPLAGKSNFRFGRGSPQEFIKVFLGSYQAAALFDLTVSRIDLSHHFIDFNTLEEIFCSTFVKAWNPFIPAA
jgi:hypothetical protein